PRDWSSDVCSSDLTSDLVPRALDALHVHGLDHEVHGLSRGFLNLPPRLTDNVPDLPERLTDSINRPTKGREHVRPNPIPGRRRRGADTPPRRLNHLRVQPLPRPAQGCKGPVPRIKDRALNPIPRRAKSILDTVERRDDVGL